MFRQMSCHLYTDGEVQKVNTCGVQVPRSRVRREFKPPPLSPPKTEEEFLAS